jgi:hypothetical protein
MSNENHTRKLIPVIWKIEERDREGVYTMTYCLPETL